MLKTYFRNLVRSFYDASLYNEAINEWQGFGGRHILFVSAFVGLLITIMLGVSFYAFNTLDLPYLLKQIPQIEIKDHAAVVHADEPVLITTRDKKFRILLNTGLQEQDLYNQDAEIVVGKHTILFRQMQGFKAVPLDNSDNYVFDRNNINDFFHKLYFFLILAWPLLTIGQALSMLGQVFVIAVASYALTAAMREEYYFETRMRIAALSATPAFVIYKTTALFTSNAFNIPFAKIWFALLLGVLYFYVMVTLVRRFSNATKVQL